MAVIRAAELVGYRRLVEELGGDADRLLERARIDPALLEREEAFVDYAAMLRALEYAARGLRCPSFGLRLSARQSLRTLGTLAVAMRNSPTVGDALACASRFLFVHSPALHMQIHRGSADGQLLIELSIRIPNPPRSVQGVEYNLASTVHVMNSLSGGSTAIGALHLAHPPEADLDEYRRWLRVPVRFESEMNAIEVAVSELERPIGGHREDLRVVAERYLELSANAPGAALAPRVESAIRRSLGTGASGFEDVAQAFGLHPRTLQRRLRDEGTSFDQLKDHARSELCRRYVMQDDLPMGQVARLLEYSEQSALTRSCRRWFGLTPRQLRAELRAERAGEG